MSLQACVCMCSLHLKHLGLLKFDIIIIIFLLEAWNNLLKHVFVKLTFVLAGCCLDMLMGSQRFKLYICWITGLAIVFISKVAIRIYIYMLDNWANPTSCLKYLESLFLYSISFNFLFSCSCRMAIFWCLTCAKPQGLLNP